MDTLSHAVNGPDQVAVEFVRFCYRRRRVGWPELYDEMCAVAGRGLFRGFGADELADLGIGFSLFHMPALAVLARQIVSEEHSRQRTLRVVGSETGATPSPPLSAEDDEPDPDAVSVAVHSLARPGADRDREPMEVAATAPRFTMAASGV